jgi:CDP-diglyceride synthetase
MAEPLSPKKHMWGALAGLLGGGIVGLFGFVVALIVARSNLGFENVFSGAAIGAVAGFAAGLVFPGRTIRAFRYLFEMF